MQANGPAISPNSMMCELNFVMNVDKSIGKFHCLCNCLHSAVAYSFDQNGHVYCLWPVTHSTASIIFSLSEFLKYIHYAV